MTVSDFLAKHRRLRKARIHKRHSSPTGQPGDHSEAEQVASVDQDQLVDQSAHLLETVHIEENDEEVHSEAFVPDDDDDSDSSPPNTGMEYDLSTLIEDILIVTEASAPKEDHIFISKDAQIIEEPHPQPPEVHQSAEVPSPQLEHQSPDQSSVQKMVDYIAQEQLSEQHPSTPPCTAMVQYCPPQTYEDTYDKDQQLDHIAEETYKDILDSSLPPLFDSLVNEVLQDIDEEFVADRYARQIDSGAESSSSTVRPLLHQILLSRLTTMSRSLCCMDSRVTDIERKITSQESKLASISRSVLQISKLLTTEERLKIQEQEFQVNEITKGLDSIRYKFIRQDNRMFDLQSDITRLHQKWDSSQPEALKTLHFVETDVRRLTQYVLPPEPDKGEQSVYCSYHSDKGEPTVVDRDKGIPLRLSELTRAHQAEVQDNIPRLEQAFQEIVPVDPGSPAQEVNKPSSPILMMSKGETQEKHISVASQEAESSQVAEVQAEVHTIETAEVAATQGEAAREMTRQEQTAEEFQAQGET